METSIIVRIKRLESADGDVEIIAEAMPVAVGIMDGIAGNAGFGHLKVLGKSLERSVEVTADMIGSCAIDVVKVETRRAVLEVVQDVLDRYADLTIIATTLDV